MHTFAGRVMGDSIEGTVMAQMIRPGSDEDIETFTLPWTARRSSTPGYFAPTGTRFLRAPRRATVLISIYINYLL